MRAVFADFNDLEDVKSKITDKTCGIICVVQAESIRQRRVLEGQKAFVMKDILLSLTEKHSGILEECDL